VTIGFYADSEKDVDCTLTPDEMSLYCTRLLLLLARLAAAYPPPPLFTVFYRTLPLTPPSHLRDWTDVRVLYILIIIIETILA